MSTEHQLTAALKSRDVELRSLRDECQYLRSGRELTAALARAEAAESLLKHTQFEFLEADKAREAAESKVKELERDAPGGKLHQLQQRMANEGWKSPAEVREMLEPILRNLEGGWYTLGTANLKTLLEALVKEAK